MTADAQLITVGTLAPDFTCLLSDNTTFTLSEQRGKCRVALIFYPGNNTPVCTAQLCAFRDDWTHLQHADCLVLGVNPAGTKQHASFAQRHHFPFPLVPDKGSAIAEQYGCRMLFGLVRRTVYLIDRHGRIAFAERGNPPIERLLATLQTLDDAAEPIHDLNAQTIGGR